MNIREEGNPQNQKLLVCVDRRTYKLYNEPMLKTRLIIISIFFSFLLMNPPFVLAQTESADILTAPSVSESQVLVNEAISAQKEEASTSAPEVSLPSDASENPVVAPIKDPVVGQATASGLDQEKKIVKAVEIQGNKTIAVTNIISKIKTRVGQEYLQYVISDDIKRLYNMGYFSDVSVDRKDQDGGFKVIFYLVEKPIVEKITFTKLRYYNSRSLLTKLNVKEGKFLDNKLLKDDVEMIKDLYSKKGLTTVSVDVEMDLDKTTNKVKLHFVIQEGYRVKIKRINVEGNKSFPDKQIVRLIKTRWAWLLNPGYLKEDLLQEDMERIRSFYERQGYIDAKADYALDYQDKGRLIVNITVDEGQRYYTGKITVQGNAVASQEEILGIMKEIKVGKIFSRELLDVDLSNIRTLYFDKGYIFADVKESTSLNPQDGKVEILLEVKEGQLAYVNKVKVQGNIRTRDIVIRRELRLNPGDQFDGAKLRRSKERLNNLGIFEEVSYDVGDTDVPNQKDLIVQVKEAKTGSFSFGGGYSSIDQIVGFVEIEQRNFDFTNWPTFTGGGQDLVIRAETGSVRNNMRLSFTEPWLFDYPIAGGFDGYRTKRIRERDVGYAYDEQRTGGDLRVDKEISEYVKAGATYNIEEVKISNMEEDVSNDLLKEVGTNWMSMMSFRLSRDTRDNIFNPRTGLLLSGTADVAGGMFGGDKDFTRFQTKTYYDIPLFLDSVLEFRLRTGFSQPFANSDDVPIFERFFAGGAYTIRGYNERKVGPLDPVTSDPIGGQSLFVGNIEYMIPLVDFLKLATFFDTGNVWSKASDFGRGGFKSGAGIGLRVKTPIGPINLDYGYPLNEEVGEEEQSGKFYFSISRGF